MLIAGLTPLMLEVQSNTFSISLTEIPIVVCLLSMQRVPMVIGATIGWCIALLLSRRRAPLKLFFNTSLIIFELAAPAAIIDATVSDPGLTRWTTWVAVVAGITLTSIVASNAVNLVIRLAGDNITTAQVIRHTGVAVANAAAGAMLTLLAIMALEVTAVSAIPLVILAVTSIVPLRRHAKLNRRYEGLLLLHEFTAGLTGSTDLGTTLTSVLSETSKVLRSSNAVILLRREDEFRMSHSPEDSPVAVANDFVWNTVVRDGLPLRLERGSSAGEDYLNATGIKDLMGVPLLHLKVNDTETDLTASEDATSFGSNSSLRAGTSPLKDKQKSFGLLSTSPKPPVSSLRSALACLHDENEADETGLSQTGKKGHRRGAGDECSGGGGSADNLDRESCNRLRKPSRFDLSASSSSSVSILLLANSSKFQLPKPKRTFLFIPYLYRAELGIGKIN